MLDNCVLCASVFQTVGSDLLVDDEVDLDSCSWHFLF